jgi:hypothetical protein
VPPAADASEPGLSKPLISELQNGGTRKPGAPVSTALRNPDPSTSGPERVHVHFTTFAVEVLIRYPVVLDKATEIDERVIGDIFSAVDRDPKLKLINSEIPAPKVATSFK